MNLFIVRTKLQALIAHKIVTLFERSKKYVVIILYQYNENEDHHSVYESYKLLTDDADYTISINQSENIYKTIIKLLNIIMKVLISKGTIYVASIDFYPLGVCLKIIPFVELKTFDDGAVNVIQKENEYYNEKPLYGYNIKRLFVRILLPKGCEYYLRNRSIKHYTIFHDHPNIVDRSRIVDLPWSWADYLDPRDLDNLPANVCCIILGTVFEELLKQEVYRSRANQLMNEADLYICHPREQDWFQAPYKRWLSSPAESILEYLSKNKKITVYHFNSTVAISLMKNGNIEFVDLIQPSGIGD